MNEIRELIKNTIKGEYKTIGDPDNYDSIIAQSFGAPEKGAPSYGKVNELLAQFIAEKTNTNVPMLLQEEVAKSLPNNLEPSLIIKGEPGHYLDSWTVLKKANTYMKERDLKNPLFIAQARHVGRVAFQGILQGMDPIVPSGLPDEFDPDSSQIWTRDNRLWVPRELATILYFYFKYNK